MVREWISGLFESAPVEASEPSPPGPSPCAKSPAWWHVMGFQAGPPRSLDNVERRFRKLAARAHPDRGGSPDQMQALLKARAEARRQLRALNRSDPLYHPIRHGSGRSTGPGRA